MVIEFDNCLLRLNSVVCCMIKGVPVESNPLQTYAVFPLIQAGSQIQAGFLIQAGGLTAFVPIEAGSPIQARSLIEAGVNGKYHRTNGIGT